MATSPAVSAVSRDDVDVENRPLEHNPQGYVAIPRDRSPSRQGFGYPPASSAPSEPKNQNYIVNKKPLRKYRVWCWLFILYIPLIVVPWVLTVILNYKPLQLASYTDPNPHPQSSFDYDDGALVAIRVLNSVAALLTVPITSFILACGAVLYAQRRRRTQHLSLQQTFALADRGWGDLRNIFTRGSPGRSFYLYFGFILVFIGMVYKADSIIQRCLTTIRIASSAT